MKKPLIMRAKVLSRARIWLAASTATLPLMAEVGDITISPAALKKLSLEQLLEQEVTTASRRPQPLSQTATAIDVINNEEIQRSGVTTIPDALRLGTGVHVARVDGHTWAITSRGFNAGSGTANKMQVMMDGRSLYSPLFTGVFWDVQHYLLEDIDRIEVIRGPGATMWGANSFNGVINILSKSAKNTQGTYLMGGGGTEENGFGGVRYGGKAGEKTYYRAYATYFNRDGLRYSNGADAHDEMMLGQTGFRTDSDLNDSNLLTIQGDFYDGLFGRNNLEDSNVGGGNLLGRWTHEFTEESDLVVQMYFDKSHRNVPRVFEENRNTFDFDVQHQFPVGERNKVMYGFNYRLSSDKIGNPIDPALAFHPTERNLQLFSGFVQDEIEIVPEYAGLILGSKFEHNDFTGFEVQPSIRGLYTPTKNQTIWAGVSRAVRTPSRIDVDFQVARLLRSQSPGHFKSEEVIAYELGYRIQPLERLSFDVAVFYNDYERLRSFDIGPGGAMARNNLEGEGYGAEFATTIQPLDWWTLRGSYTYFEADLDFKRGGIAAFPSSTEGNDPQHMVTVHSSLNLPYNLEFDQIVRFVDDLPSPRVPGYIVLDLRLGWEPKKGLEFSIVGQNLLDTQHQEFSGANATEVEQSVYGKVAWHF